MLELLYMLVTGPGLTLTVFGVGVFMSLSLMGYMRPAGLLRALKSSPKEGMTPKRAMCFALAGTLGVGNIVGVASAISIGGAGTIFWMWVSSFFAIWIKYSETLLALKRRRRFADGWHGGAFFYISDFGTEPSRGFAVFFALLCLIASLTLGSSIQSNAAAICLEKAVGASRGASGIMLGLICLIVVPGGRKRIADITSAAISAASIGFVLLSLIIIFSNLRLIGGIFHEILVGALGKKAFEGGILGFLTSKALALGVTRGIVSNEAGCGTAPIAHSGSDVAEPAAQGVWGMVEVIVDTPILCTLTALVMLIADMRGLTLPTDGTEAALAAFGGLFPHSRLLICVFMTVFAIATILCWFYYGSEALRFLFGSLRLDFSNSSELGGKASARLTDTQMSGEKALSEVKADSKASKNVGSSFYIIIYSLAATLGAFTSGAWLWQLSDLTIGLMTIVNLFFTVRRLPEIRCETYSYFSKDGQNFVSKRIEKRSKL